MFEAKSQREAGSGIDDNARKFTIERIDAGFLAERGAKTYELITDWLMTDEMHEEKVVRKEHGGGKVEYLHITKVTENSSRSSTKEKISVIEYQQFLGASILRVEKRRSEFDYLQDEVLFALKYDEFRDGTCVLEVDAGTDGERASFNPAAFPYALEEVTGDIRYYGYRIARVIAAPKS